MTDCQHPTTRVLVVVSKCEECDAVVHTRIESSEADQFAAQVLRVRQFKISKEIVLKDSRLTVEQRRMIESIEPCYHNIGEYKLCCGGVTRWVCTDCGRKFGDGLKPAHAVEATSRED